MNNETHVTRSNFRLMAVLTTVSPLHITEPGEARVTLDGKLAQEGYPLSKVTRMSVSNSPLVLRAAADGSDASEGASKGPFTEVPVIPANTIRGMLRRRAAEEVSKALLARGEKLSVGAYNVLICGAATGNPDSADPTVDELLRSSRHPYFGTFGGGPRILRSRLRVDSALAISNSSAPYLDPHFEVANTGVDAWRLVEIGWKRRADDVYKMAGSTEHRQIIENYEKAINDYQDSNAEEKAKKRAGSEDAAKGLATLNAREFVKVGTHFAVTLELTDATEAQAGILINSVLGWVQAGRLGGAGALGCGRFMLQHITLEEEGQQHSQGKLVATSTGAELTGRFAELTQAWEQAAKSISAGEIEAFAKPSGKLSAKKAAAAGAALAAAAAQAGQVDA